MKEGGWAGEGAECVRKDMELLGLEPEWTIYSGLCELMGKMSNPGWEEIDIQN